MNTSVKVALSQIEVIAGRPDLNVKKILLEVAEARRRQMDMIVFSEMVVPGYLLGDEWENNSFISDLMQCNDEILEASKDIVVIWGNVFAEPQNKGEDGRVRKYNAAYIAQDGKWVENGIFLGHTYKTLMPKYREFDDERHFFSMSMLAKERNMKPDELLNPFKIKVNGKEVRVGLILCEDMWSDDYQEKPIRVLINKGSDMMVNLSCSPWTWRKNDKRHRVVKSHLEEGGIPFIYCNNVGIQNNGKNIFLFDGCSAAYNSDGSLKAMARSYTEETVDIVVSNENGAKIPFPELSEEQDVAELYNGLVYGLRKFFTSAKKETVVIGLSGGIDSAVVACLLSQALGRDKVYAVNMPSKYNSELTKSAAEKLAENLGVNYAVMSIQAAVDLTEGDLKSVTFISKNNLKTETKLEVDGYSMENIQARDRGSRLLAAVAACLGGVLTNNGNKSETTIGYCTLYGDVNGAVAPIADLYKGEVYQLAKYINSRAGKDVIPTEIMTVVPSAELSASQDVTKGKGDPMNYPYHDKLFRAFVEFRRDPEDILRLFLEGRLENELKLGEGALKRLFKDANAFIADMEHKWRLYKLNTFKRIQAPPIIAVSRRAFGFDLRESQNGVYFTKNYLRMKEEAKQ